MAIAIFLCLSYSHRNFAQNQPIGVVGFYNVENLFDTEDGPNNDEDFLPGGVYGWDKSRYQEKLNSIGKVIGSMAGGPDIVGLAEVENRKVIEDLISTESLAPHRYQIVHYESPDYRGIDVALIYKAGKFVPFAMKQLVLNDPNNPQFKTRDMLWVKGLYFGDTLNVVVNHWPSRRGGKEDMRVRAGNILRQAIDSVQQINPAAKIILMGDFNDDPIDKSVKKELRADMKKLKPGDLYNASLPTYKKGYGTLMYRGLWNLFDQIIISQSLLDENSDTYAYQENSFQIFAPDWMQTQDGNYAGAPFRTFVSGVYYGGYSDHYPTFIVLSK